MLKRKRADSTLTCAREVENHPLKVVIGSQRVDEFLTTFFM